MDLLVPSRIERYQQELRNEETPEPEPLEPRNSMMSGNRATGVARCHRSFRTATRPTSLISSADGVLSRRRWGTKTRRASSKPSATRTKGSANCSCATSCNRQNCRENQLRARMPSACTHEEAGQLVQEVQRSLAGEVAHRSPSERHPL
jgi:hypothetical protein